MTYAVYDDAVLPDQDYIAVFSHELTDQLFSAQVSKLIKMLYIKDYDPFQTVF